MADCQPSAELLAIDADTLRRVGLSRAKSACLYDVAPRLVDGRVDLSRLCTLGEDAARNARTRVKDVGRFTAHGVLLRALRRPDLSRRGSAAAEPVARVWELDKPSLADVDAVRERLRPWRTLAAVYLLTDGRAEPENSTTRSTPRSRR